MNAFGLISRGSSGTKVVGALRTVACAACKQTVAKTVGGQRFKMTLASTHISAIGGARRSPESIYQTSASFAARYSTETQPPPKDGADAGKPDGKAKKEKLLPSSGPLSPIGIGLFLLSAGGILYYFTVRKEQIRLERLANQNRQETFGKPHVGGPFELTDHTGQAFGDVNLRGKFALIYFGFCHCPDICPDELDKIGDALEILDRNPLTKDAVQPVFITCDPQRDSPEAIEEYLQQFHPKFVGLTGSIDQIRSACKAFRVYFSKPPKVAENQDYLVDHSIFSYFMDPNGEFVDVYGKDRTAEYMAADIERRVKQFVAAGGKIQKKAEAA
ncbi:Cu-binding protein [Coemansia sp. RSA 2599]|nr:Cu-binding protein [Coemansia sp. RSA 2598]KAJ1824323.1 Cu-binding protein [Coemansia sp. RSA 2599]